MVQWVTPVPIVLVVCSTLRLGLLNNHFCDPVKTAKKLWHRISQVDQYAVIKLRRGVADLYGGGDRFGCFAINHVRDETMLRVVPQQLIHRLGGLVVIDVYVYRVTGQIGFTTQSTRKTHAGIDALIFQDVEIHPGHA